MFPEDVKTEILDRTDIVALIGQTVQLRKAGTIFKGLCPFHSEKTPSFTVSPERRTFHCFGCQKHGNAIDFVMESEGLSFRDALEKLAHMCGMELPETKRESPEVKAERARQKSEKERLIAVQEKLASYYADTLFGPFGQPARDYLIQRRVSPKSVQAFRLGYATGDKADFARFVMAHQLPLGDLVTLGFLMPPENPTNISPRDPLRGHYLRFRRRVMFPVLSPQGEVVGFTGRVLDAQIKTAKYMNSPETPIFIKGENLYGISTARSAVHRKNRLILCEGNLDVIMLWQSGIEEVAAAMGTALTSKQAQLIHRLTDQVFCVMDGDAAGQKATLSSLITFLQAGIEPRAVRLPPEEDPDSFVRKFGPQAFERLLEQAEPLLDLAITRAIQTHPQDLPGRAACLKALAPYLAEIKDPLIFELYRTKLAQQLAIHPDLVDKAIEACKTAHAETVPESNQTQVGHFTGQKSRSPRPPKPANQTVKKPSDSCPPEQEKVLEFIMHFPKCVLLFHQRNAYECLTQPGLADFVSSLYTEVAAEPELPPNIDQLLEQQGDEAVKNLLWKCRIQDPSQNDDTIEQAFSDALTALQRGHLQRQRGAITSRMVQLFSTPGPELEQCQEQLKTIQEQLALLSRPSLGKEP